MTTKYRIAEKHMVAIQREAAKIPVAEVAGKHKMSGQTIDNENAKLERILAKRDLEVDTL
jgi:hypothetical protein